MNIKISLRLLTVMALSVISYFLSTKNSSFAQAKSKTESDWSYFDNKGPKNWGNLNAKFESCKFGLNQSPIDITAEIFAEHDLQFGYKTAAAEKTSEKFAARLNLEGGGEVLRSKKIYYLRYLTFHHPSEHKISGKESSFEIEIFHKSEDEQWLVVSLFVELGKKNNHFEPLISTLEATIDSTELEKHRANRVNQLLFDEFSVDFSGSETASQSDQDSKEKNKNPELNLQKVFSNFNFTSELAFFYEGSLTTPPCTEGIKRYIFKNPIQLSKNQFNRLIKTAIYIAPNARPVQKFSLKKF